MPVSESAHFSAAITDPGYRRASLSAATKRLLIRHFFLSPTASSAFARRPKTLLLTKKGRRRLCTRFSFGRDVYATGDSPTARVFDCHDPVRAYGRDFSRGAETCTDAAGRNYDIRADCGEGRVECCNSVYDSNGFARADNLSLWRRHIAPVFRGTISATSRQANAARPWLGRDCQSGWIHHHCQSRRFGRGRNNGGPGHRAPQIQGQKGRHRSGHRRGAVKNRREKSPRDHVCR